MSKKWFWIWICFIFTIVLAVVMIWWFWGREKYPLFEKKAGKCLVFEEKDCSQGKACYEGEEMWSVGFKLEKNSVIFSPIDGDIEVQNTNYSNGKKVLVVFIVGSLPKEGDLAYQFFIDGKMYGDIGKKVTKGQPIARVNSPSIEKDNVYLRIINSMQKSNEDKIYKRELNLEEMKKYIKQ